MNTDVSVILGMTCGFLPFAILPLFVSIHRPDPNLVAAARALYASGRDAFTQQGQVRRDAVVAGTAVAWLVAWRAFRSETRGPSDDAIA